ncbi:unnamed protein product, partial [Closterium sp. Naga37s-1]
AFLLALARILHGGSLPLHNAARKRKTKLPGRCCSPLRVLLLLLVLTVVSVALLLRSVQLQQKNAEEAGPKGFIRYSAYRLGRSSFAVIGLGALRLRARTRFPGCSWHDNGAAPGEAGIPGSVEVFYPGEHHDLEYETVVLKCFLRAGTHATQGGKLLLQVQVQATQGSRVLSVNTQQLVAYHEPPNAFPVSLEPHPPYKHRVAFCSPPVHSELDGRRLYEWLEYHYHLGVDYSIMYDAGGIDDEVTQVLIPYEQEGLLEVRDIGDFLEYETWLYAQVMVVNDCSYSTRHSAKWTLFFDLDEFFNADDPPPPQKVEAHTHVLATQLDAMEHWHRQLSRLRKRFARERRMEPRPQREMEEEEEEKEASAAAGAAGAAGAAAAAVAQAAGQGLAHRTRISLEQRRAAEQAEEANNRQNGTRIGKETAKARQQRVARQMREQYRKLRARRKEDEAEEEKEKLPGEEEQQRHLQQQEAEQQSQMEVIRAYREHLKRTAGDQRLIPLVLESYDGASYLSLGTLWWDTERCVDPSEAKGTWGIQRMFYHWPHIYCLKPELFPRSEMCLDYYGHRKYAINPRKVTALQIHRPVLNDSYGFDLDTTVAKLNHFQGYVQRVKPLNATVESGNSNETASVAQEQQLPAFCSHIIHIDEPIIWWARGQEIGEIAAEAQKNPRVPLERIERAEMESEMARVEVGDTES